MQFPQNTPSWDLFNACRCPYGSIIEALRRPRSGRQRATKTSCFIEVKRCNFCLRVSPEPLSFLKIIENGHTKCQGHKKRCSYFSTLWVYLCHAYTACIQGNFQNSTIHTEASDKRLFRRSVSARLVN